MTRNDIEGFILFVVALIGCWYHNELADIIGIALNHLFSIAG